MPARGEDVLGGAHAGPLRLLEEGEPAEVGRGEAAAPERARGAFARGPEEEAGRRAHHAVRPAHDVDRNDVPLEVVVDGREVAEHGVAPALPGRREDAAPRARGVRVGERAVPRPHGRALAPVGLVRRVHVAERSALADHVVPRERETVGGGRLVERHVRDDPGARGEALALVLEPAHDAPGGEARQGAHDVLGRRLPDDASHRVEPAHDDAVRERADLEDDDPGADPRGVAGGEGVDEATVALRPGQQRSRLVARYGDAGREVVERGPGARPLEGGAEVVAARVLDVPAKRPRGEALAREPGRRADPVERDEVGVPRAPRRRDGERAPALVVAPPGAGVDDGTEALVLAEIVRRRPGEREEPLVPDAAVEEPLLGVAAERALDGERAPLRVEALDDPGLPEQLAQRPLLPRRARQVVGAERVARHGVLARGRRAADAVLELEEDEVRRAGAREAPRGREPRDAAARDDHRHVLAHGRRGEGAARPQAMASVLRRPDDAALDPARAPAARERERGGGPHRPRRPPEHVAAALPSPAGQFHDRTSSS